MHTEELLEHGFLANTNNRIRRPPLDALTGLRFLAALYVMLFHFGAAFTSRIHLPRPVTAFLEYGNLGVCLFFLLSGFILLYTYAGNLQSPRDHYRFFVARFCRIYPVYLLAAGAECLVNQRLPRGSELSYFTLLQSWTPASSPHGYLWITQAWTLSVEVFFYGCFPVLLPLVMRITKRAVLWTLVISIALFIGLLELPLQHAGMGSPVAWVFLPLLRIPEFCLGMLMGRLFLERDRGTSVLRHNSWITFAGMLPAIALIACSASSQVVSLAAVFWFTWAIYRLASGTGWLAELLSTKIFILLGGASYSIYLLQSPVRELLRQHVGPMHPSLDAALSPIVLIAVSIVIFLYYEEPLRERLRSALTTPHRS